MITELLISNFRNLTSIELKPNPSGLNILFGENASGKTSLLEAIHVLGCNKSFRSRETPHIIQHEKPCLTLFSRLNAESKTIGVEKSRQGETKLRLNGEKAKSTASIAECLPIQLITPHHLMLLDLGPQAKREFLDWGVFHVEHEFIAHWKLYKHILKQRNAALKSKQADKEEIFLWNQQLTGPAEKVTELRERYLSDFNEFFKELILEVLPDFEIELILKSGWNTEESLNQIWESDFQKDRAIGHTHHGPHRANLIFKANGKPAEEVLSRGQQKLLVHALKISQGQHLKSKKDKACVYLIDDITSELDDKNQHKIIELLLNSGSQIFATMLEEPKALYPSAKLFHIENGLLTEKEKAARPLSNTSVAETSSI